MATGIQISALPSAPALTGNELVPLVSVGHISSITQASVAVVTISDSTPTNPFLPDETVSIQGIAGGSMVQMNGQGAVVSAVGGVSGAWTITLPINSSGFAAYVSGSGGTITATASIPLLSMRLSSGTYDPTFQSGDVQRAGPGGTVAADHGLIFGNAIPNPGGVPGPALLVGSGGGLGINVSAWFITDQAFDVNTPGNDIGHTAGEVQPGSTQRGGNWSSYAGGADFGMGGQWLGQGGTSARGLAGLTVLQGANNTDQSHPAGDVFMIAGQVGSVGATYHLIMTMTNGVAGVGRTRVNSTIIRDDYSDGRVFSYPSNGFGAPLAPWISRGPTAGQAAGWAGSSEVATGTAILAKRTTGGTEGSLTIVNGLITAIVNPT